MNENEIKQRYISNLFISIGVVNLGVLIFTIFEYKIDTPTMILILFTTISQYIIWYKLRKDKLREEIEKEKK